MNRTERREPAARQVLYDKTVDRVLTFRSNENEQEDLKLSVKIPNVEMISQDTNGLAESYKKAFIDTGETREERQEHNLEIRGWYEIAPGSVGAAEFEIER